MSDAPTTRGVRGCVAVAVETGSDLSAEVGEHFGRSPRFLLVRDGQERTIQVLENTGGDATRGAGPATASLLVRNGVTAVLAGRFGPKAEDALRAGGVRPIEVSPRTRASEALSGLPPEMLQATD
jgi:predicted Fe-Mo cluster-binding NifX family protein